MREVIDRKVREIRRDENYRTKPRAAKVATAAAGAFGYSATGRAKALRGYMKGLK